MSNKTIEEPKSQIKPKSSACRVLEDSELDGVSGGMLQSAISIVIKSIGEGMAAAAAKAEPTPEVRRRIAQEA
jgi:hypothetical protein